MLSNPFLDGLSGITRSQRYGVSGLTIQKGSKPPASGLTVAPPAVSPTAPPVPSVDPAALSRIAANLAVRPFG